MKKYELYSWIELQKHLHLTLKDLQELEVGKEYDVVIFDRNFDEQIWDKFNEFQVYQPEEIFKNSHHKIVYKGNMHWDIIFSFGETLEHPVHLDVSSLPTNWTWCAIENKYINITNEVLDEGETIDPERGSIKMHYKWFPENTRVGWRGPIMFWKDLTNLPKVYWIDPLRLNLFR